MHSEMINFVIKQALQRETDDNRGARFRRMVNTIYPESLDESSSDDETFVNYSVRISALLFF